MFGVLYLSLIAFLSGWFVDTLAQDQMPGKLWGTVFAVLIGGVIGAFLPAVNHIGINIAGVALLPAIVGDIAALFIMLIVKKIIKPALHEKNIKKNRGKAGR